MCQPFNEFSWCEVTKEEIENAGLLSGEYVEKEGKYYTRPGMLDGYICPCFETLILKKEFTVVK